MSQKKVKSLEADLRRAHTRAKIKLARREENNRETLLSASSASYFFQALSFKTLV